MDVSGRFNFWQMLIHTRTVIPPRLRESGWLLWGAVLLVMVAAGGLALHLSLQPPALQATVSDRPSVNTEARPAPRALTW